MEDKKGIESILLANSYLIKCKFETTGDSVEHARRNLTQRVKSVLIERFEKSKKIA